MRFAVWKYLTVNTYIFFGFGSSHYEYNKTENLKNWYIKPEAYKVEVEKN